MTRITETSDACHSFPNRIESIIHKVKAMLVETKIQIGHFFPLTADKLFGDLPPKLWKQLNCLKKIKRFRKGAVVHKADEMPWGFYVLIEGRIRLRLNDGSVARLIEPSGIFGLTEMIAGLSYQMKAETVTPCVCEYIGREEFVNFLQAEPEMCFRLLRRLALNLQENHQFLCSSII